MNYIYFGVLKNLASIVPKMSQPNTTWIHGIITKILERRLEEGQWINSMGGSPDDVSEGPVT